MGKLADQAVNNHRNYHSCSAAVLCAFHEMAGLSEQQAEKEAAPFASGRAGKCGAVMAAEYVLKQVYNKDAEGKIAEFEKKFMNHHKGSVMCHDLMGSCRACVTDAAWILEDTLEQPD